jgi:hypothetical protein
MPEFGIPVTMFSIPVTVFRISVVDGVKMIRDPGVVAKMVIGGKEPAGKEATSRDLPSGQCYNNNLKQFGQNCTLI